MAAFARREPGAGAAGGWTDLARDNDAIFRVRVGAVGVEYVDNRGGGAGAL
jgi:hypothetical protein